MTAAPYLTAARAARAIGCTKQWITRLAAGGDIPGAFRPEGGGPWCIPRAWVGDALLATLILRDAETVSDRKREPFTSEHPIRRTG